MKSRKLCFLSGNALKLIAAVSMLIDHTGMILFPRLQIMRIIGRLAFPIFSYLIYEGCKHTRNKKAYLLRMLLLGLAMSAVQLIATGELYLNVLVTFSLSITLIFSVTAASRVEDSVRKASLLALALLLSVLYALLTKYLEIDYGFFGIMLPVSPAIADAVFGEGERGHPMKLSFLFFALMLVLLSYNAKWVQPYCLFALIPLALYSGKRGLRLPKYFFYVFYPVHIALLWVLAFLV